MSKKTHSESSDRDEPQGELESPGARSGESDASATDGDRTTSATDRETSGAGGTELERLRRENAENLAHWKRATADYQNLRRRLQADIDAAAQRSKQPLLLDLLLVLDYLEMALKTPCTTTEGKNLAAGVELTRSVLLRALERENVRAVPETGKFDPAVHQAVERVETDAEEAGTILGTLRRGYACNGQVIRPGQVRVAAAPARDAVKRESAARDAGASGANAEGTES